MSFILITTLFLAAFVGLVFKKYRIVFWLMFISIGLLFGIGTGFLPGLMSESLQSYGILNTAKWSERNAIIVLGAGINPRLTTEGERLFVIPFFGNSRILEGARQYFKCRSSEQICKVILSGGDPSHYGVSESEIMFRAMTDLNVPSEDIIQESKSLNTFQNAMETKGVLKNSDFQLKILVTSGFHLKRALKYFEFFEISAIPAPSDELVVSHIWWPSAINFTYFDLMFHEWIGILKMDFFNFMGWNSPAGGPGTP